jgi:hypothetical protein
VFLHANEFSAEWESQEKLLDRPPLDSDRLSQAATTNLPSEFVLLTNSED